MKLLVVDDHEQNRCLLHALLTGHGHEVVLAADGAEALETARNDPPELILSDILMPVMDGYALCREWTRDKRLKKIPFAFYAATYTDPKDKEFALSLGADRFIVRPQEPDVLLRTIEKIIAERRNGSPATPREPVPEETVDLKQYNETLIRDLEDKTTQLETATRAQDRELIRLREADEELRLYETIVAGTSDGINLVRLSDLTIMYVNPRFEEMFGREPGELPGKPVNVLHAGDEVSAAEKDAEIRQALLEHGRWRGEILSIRKDGTTFPSLLSVSTFEHSTHGTVAISATVDITLFKEAEKGLRESENRFRMLFQHIAVGVAQINSNTGQFVRVNPRYCDILGYSRDEMKRLDCQSITHPDDLATNLANMELLKAGKIREFTMEKRYLRKDGSTVWVNLTVSPLWPPGEPPDFHVAVVEDITQRKREQELLRLRETQLTLVHDCVYDPVFAVSVEPGDGFRFVSVNRSFLEKTGLSEDQIIGQQVKKVIPEPAYLVVIGKYREAIQSRQPVHWEEVSEYPAGTKTGAVTVVPFFDESGNCTQLVGTVHDITELRHAEQELRRSNTQLSTAEVVARMGSWAYDLASETGTWSVNMFRMFEKDPAYSDAPTFKVFIETLVHPDDRKRVERRLADALAGKAPYNVEYRILRRNGEERIIRESAVMETDAEDQLRRMYGIAQDITEQRTAEDEQRIFAAKMVQMQKLESLGVMAGGIAHEFNNILQTILGNADIALAEMRPDTIGRDCLSEIEGAVRRAEGLTDQMLAYSGNGALVLKTVNLSELVQEMAQLLDVSHAKKVILEHHAAESLPAIKGDPAQLNQAVMNLTINASEAEGGGVGTIAIETGVTECTREYLAATYFDDGLEAGRYVYLDVTDSGCGMDEEIQRRLFEPFFTTKFTGRGLGMAATLGILRAHKGAIDLDSAPGHGTTIRLLFPALEETGSKSPGEVVTQESAWRGSGTVLVVDDEPQIRDLTKTVFESSGFAVLTAADGHQAIKQFAENKDDIVCVLLDLTMPRMGGEETLVELHRIRNDVPIVLMSGYSEEHLAERVEDLGFAAFLKKPVQRGELLETVRGVLAIE